MLTSKQSAPVKCRPAPVPFTYTDDNGTTKKAYDLSDVVADPNVNSSLMTLNSPGVGEFLIPVIRQSIADLDNFQNLYEPKFINFLKNLEPLIGKPNNQSELQSLFARQDPIIKKYAHQYLFVTRIYSPATKKKMFDLCADIFDLDMTKILICVLISGNRTKEALEIFGAQYANAVFNDFPAICAGAAGRVNDGQTLSEFDLFLQHGCNFNLQHPTNGTYLHNLLANEFEGLAIAIAHRLLKANPPYNFAAQDSGSKTPLMIATKTRQSDFVIELCKLKQINRVDIGLEVADDLGLTPILYAAALGDLQSFMALAEAGANLRATDHSGKGLEFYMHASPELIDKMLASIHIVGARDAKATHNWLYFNDPIVRPATNTKSSEPYKRVLLSFTPEHLPVLKDAIDQAKHDPELSYWYGWQIYQILRDSLDAEQVRSWITYGHELPKRQTLTQACLEGQKLVQNFYESLQRQPVTIRKLGV